MVHIFSGDNPTKLYLESLEAVLRTGDDVSPRGKKILEIRPAVFQFTNPLNRVTFVKGRVINPFFQLAESLWILSGKSDVASLLPYNSAMGQFSDNGIDFHAPYGERLRSWNKCSAEGFVFNPLDQLVDVYKKIQADRDTRQAVAVIYNPLFDNNFIQTVDRPCNMILTFKVRKNKLEMVVFNRSNDLHWGLFGANLCQFSTIQEVMASWLGLEVGTYTHITDSLHVYLEDYGNSISKEIMETEQGEFKTSILASDTELEPRMTSDFETFHRILQYFEQRVAPILLDPKEFLNAWKNALDSFLTVQDLYLRTVFLSMAAYQAHKLDMTEAVCSFMSNMPDCQWKISCLRYLSPKYNPRNTSHHIEFLDIFKYYPQEIKDYIMRTDIKG